MKEEWHGLNIKTEMHDIPIGYKDFIHYGSESACRDAGKLSIEGKEYKVSDGDVMHFRFNV